MVIVAPDEAEPECPTCGFTGEVDDARPAPKEPGARPSMPMEAFSKTSEPTAAPSRPGTVWINCPACSGWVEAPLGGPLTACPACGAHIMPPRHP